MANWKEDLERQFDEEFTSPSPTVTKKRKPRVVRKKTTKRTVTSNKTTSDILGGNNTFVLPLFLLICILSISLVASYNFRKRGSVYAATPPAAAGNNLQVLQDYQQDAIRHQEYLFNQQKSEWQAERRQFEDQAEVAIRETWGRTKTNRERVTLLGILYNNNMAAMRAGTRDYIFINGDWTIDRYPNHLNLDEEDRQFLSKFIRK